MKRRQTWLLLATLLWAAASPAAARKWTNDTGKFSIEAELVEVKNGNVHLKRQNGKIITVRLAKLSKADRAYVASLAKNKPEVPESTREEAIAAIKKLGGFIYLGRNGVVEGVRLINNPNVTDADLRHLRALNKLEFLGIFGPKFTDAGLANLKGLTNLERLSLYTSHTAAGLKQITGLPKLKTLILIGNGITDARLVHLKGMTNLDTLTLNSTKITSGGLKHIKGLTQLKALYLRDTKINDAGLKYLEGLTNLGELELRGTKVTRKGLKKIQQVLPNCKINWGASTAKVATGPKRKWTHERGNFSFEAKLVEIRGDRVLLEKVNGTTVSYPIASLSKADRVYLASGSKTKAKPKIKLPAAKPPTREENKAAILAVLLHRGRVKYSGQSRYTNLVSVDKTVVGVLLGRFSNITDATLEPLKALSQLKAVTLSGPKLTDACLEHLKGLTQLKMVKLSHTQVSGEGLRHLDQLANLAHLDLSGTGINDAGLEHIKGLTQVKRLNLNGTKVGDAGLEHLKGLSKLEQLYLNGTKITDAGLKHLLGLSNLSALGLNGTAVTDAGLERLKGLTRLKYLSLSGTKITDAGTKHLTGLTKLDNLIIEFTKVTDEGAKALKRALPKCKVWHTR